MGPRDWCMTLHLFPFAALQGQPVLQQALLLAAVDPLLGGVLIEGPRGMAKTTSARALADLLPPPLVPLPLGPLSGQEAIALADEAVTAETVTAEAALSLPRFVNLPLGTTLEQLVGTLDLQAALRDSRVQWRPGLLAQAHGGVLYVDEVNLLDDALVDVLLDVCASGINRVERDGISHQHPARITLVGTMNPEEGPLRPQLLDRFGLCVRLGNIADPATRQSIVRTRMAFDADPAAFIARHAQAQAALARQVAAARDQVLQAGVWPDAVHDHVARLCHDAGVQGVRADLVMLRAARAQAALQGRSCATLADVNAVAELVLAHRRDAHATAAGPGAPHTPGSPVAGPAASSQPLSPPLSSTSSHSALPSVSPPAFPAASQAGMPSASVSGAGFGAGAFLGAAAGMPAAHGEHGVVGGTVHDAARRPASSGQGAAVWDAPLDEALDRLHGGPWGAMPAPASIATSGIPPGVGSPTVKTTRPLPKKA